MGERFAGQSFIRKLTGVTPEDFISAGISLEDLGKVQEARMRRQRREMEQSGNAIPVILDTLHRNVDSFTDQLVAEETQSRVTNALDYWKLSVDQVREQLMNTLGRVPDIEEIIMRARQFSLKDLRTELEVRYGSQILTSDQIDLRPTFPLFGQKQIKCPPYQLAASDEYKRRVYKDLGVNPVIKNFTRFDLSVEHSTHIPGVTVFGLDRFALSFPQFESAMVC